MRKREAGQAFVLVLILLAIGALLVIPALRLTTTVLKSNQAITQRNKGLYACEAAQEKILWLLYNDIDGIVSETLRDDGDSISFTVDVCGTTVYAGITMRATEWQGGIALATEHVIKPTKTVEVEGHPEWSNPDGSVNVPNDYSGPYTYTIKLDQLSTDTSEGLDCVYDVLPKGLDYVDNSSHLRVDGGEWEDFPDPLIETKNVGGVSFGGQLRLRWPSSGFFTSPMRDFAVRQVKEIKFEATGGLSPGTTNYNWVLLKLGDIDTLSGPVAPIILGTGAGHVGGLLEVSKSCDPLIIQPGVETPVKYTIEIKNLSGLTQQIQSLTDYLPPGFEYCTTQPDPEVPPEPEPYAVYHPDATLPSGITTSNPDEITILTREGEEDRYRLYWAFSPAVSIADYKDEEDILTLTFWARTTQDVSGSYYNEVTVEPATPIPDIFQPPDMNVTYGDYNTTYSWNTGMVVVPAYDSSTGAEGENITASIGFELDQVRIISWHAE